MSTRHDSCLCGPVYGLCRLLQNHNAIFQNVCTMVFHQKRYSCAILVSHESCWCDLFSVPAGLWGRDKARIFRSKTELRTKGYFGSTQMQSLLVGPGFLLLQEKTNTDHSKGQILLSKMELPRKGLFWFQWVSWSHHQDSYLYVWNQKQYMCAVLIFLWSQKL